MALEKAGGTPRPLPPLDLTDLAQGGGAGPRLDQERGRRKAIGC